ncbi:DUF4350 domain-containing protein [Fulvivirga sp. RKSG066]|uniref:DUF4350 domain-containing protein n=1 Tax=Fulvivirga aurantia TaxID=2529383 RepID=UPI0012BC4D25|nr:DUF4350 domain-containing protein [Fulvivirga aurantia]MTI20150.1 DUF4350 domain-containing protein [Fulvivirga aurantia]
MKKDVKYIAILVACVVFYTVMEIITPKPINWTVTLASLDKNPFGTYLLDQRMGDLFEKTTKSNLTFYELKDSVYQNYFILSQQFGPSQEDTDALLTHVANGSNVLIASNYYTGRFADTLDLNTADYLFQGNIFTNLDRGDTAALSFTNPKIDAQEFYYQRDNAQNYFSEFDSLQSTILSLNDIERATFIKRPWGDGNIYLCSTPLAFTNNYLVYEDNHEYISHMLSYLPAGNIHWTEFYQLGRMEARTPLRFILSQESLKWAYYISLLTLIFFLFFEAKRKQRIIPIIKPLQNDTLDFIGTISNLYYQNKAHKSIATKKINFFLDQLRQHYFITMREENSDFITHIAHKTGNAEEDVKSLFDLINTIRKKTEIEASELTALNKKLEAFKLN